MSSASIVIRAERPSDEAAIRRVHVEAFPTDAEARLVDALRASSRLMISLVAVRGDEILGHVSFSPVSVAGTDTGGLGLAPVAVRPALQRLGIGAQLVRAGLEECRQRGKPFVVVLGEPEYYSRFGFVAASRWRLLDEFGGGDAFQAIELQHGGLTADGGLVRYSPEFSDFA